METMTHTPLNVDLKKMDYKPLSENWHQTCMPQRICVYLILQFISSRMNGLFVFQFILHGNQFLFLLIWVV